ncbi:MAG: MtnX-like HAD-IB family phosphatase [Pseudomonadota bacterium]
MKARSPRDFTKELILCDFDGTITKEDVGYDFLNRFTRESWEDIDRDYVEGKIGSKEAYTRIAKLIVGTQQEMVDFICSHSSLDDYFGEFYAFCRDKGADLKIVSDGFSLYINALLSHHNISGIEHFANRITFRDKDRMEIGFPFYNPDCGSCGNCKRKVLKSFRDRYDHIIFIGNGLSDRCIAEEADEVYAKGSLYSHCIETGIACWNYDDFSDIRKNLSKNIRGIIFDLDGTLIDSARSIHESFNYTLKYFGHQPLQPDRLRVRFQNSIMNALKELVKPSEVNDAMKLLTEQYIQRVMSDPSLFSDVRGVISSLKDFGLVLGVATNMEGKYAKKILRQSKIEGYFTSVIGVDHSGRAKPNPDVIYHALRAMNLRGEDVVFVGDSTVDIETGKNAEIDVYAVPTGFETKERLSEKRPRRLLNRLEDLIMIVEGKSLPQKPPSWRQD